MNYSIHQLQKQNGLALIVSIIILIVMSIAGIALVRSIDTGIFIAGNLAFRQSATQSGDSGIEAARTWLMSNMTSLQNDNAAQGYYANRQPSLDLTGSATSDTSDDVRWKDYKGDVQSGSSTPKCLDPNESGNRVCYIIHRICEPGTIELSSTYCATKSVSAGNNSLGGKNPDSIKDPSRNYAFFRITVRVAGPRNNLSYVQTFMTFESP